MAKLLVPPHILSRILNHARSESPLECCGLLGGHRTTSDWHVKSLHLLINELASPTRYRSEPASLLKALKAVRLAGEEVVAIYHSHPTSDPVPSLVDRDWHWADDVVDLIIGLAGSTPQYRAWLLNPWPAHEVLVEEWSGFRGDVGQASHFQADLKIRDAGEDQIDAHKRADYPKT